MHQEAFDNLTKFYYKYVRPMLQNRVFVLDVGSQDVKEQSKEIGSVRDLFSGCKYVGIDLQQGDNVDIVYEGGAFPFLDQTFEVIISTSCFEHDSTFWVTFSEMCRVLKWGGLIYLNAPSEGPVHKYPVDCYRFYPDAWPELARWQGLKMLEQYIESSGYWKDNVGIMQKI